jgi:hypothetical protein
MVLFSHGWSEEEIMNRWKKALMLIVISFGWLVNHAVARDDKKPELKAEEIIAKHIAAIGGKEALAKIKSRVAVAVVKKETDPDARSAIMSEAPQRLSAVMVFPQYDWRLFYDGSKSFFQPGLGKEFSVLEDQYRRMLASGAMFNSISLFNVVQNPAPSDKFEAKGIKKVSGRQAYVVELSRANQATIKLYFDAENFYWLRTEFGSVTLPLRSSKQLSNNAGSLAQENPTVDFVLETSDFREVDGLKLPFKFTMTCTTPIMRQRISGTITGTISQYQHNVAIDPKMFQ